MKSKLIPQFELPTVSREVFNLIVENAEDGERVRRETEVAAQQQREAKELELKQQKNLL